MHKNNTSGCENDTADCKNDTAGTKNGNTGIKNIAILQLAYVKISKYHFHLG